MKRTAVITGAAGGIGAALAEGYLRAGYQVSITDKDADRLEAVTQTLVLNYGKDQLYSAVADLSSETAITAFMDAAANRFNRMDVLINNAGFGITKSLFELNVEEWDSVLNTNLRGAFLCGREAAKRMKVQSEGGSIVHIASTRALMSEVNTEAYAASKGGMVALTHAMAASLAPFKIRVNSVSPGWIETRHYDELREQDHNQHWSGRVGRSEDIVRACLYLTDVNNDFVNGTNLIVDGGMTHKMIYEE
nr:SDR family oxidoreductase [Paenibacillus pinihumi]